MVVEGWGDNGSLWDPRLHLAGRRVVRRYAMSHLTRLCPSLKQWIISMRRRCETVSNAFKMPGRAERYGMKPWSLCFSAFKIGIKTEFFQITGMSTLATKMLKSYTCQTMLTEMAEVGPLGPWAGEEPTFHTVAVVEVPHEPSECLFVFSRTGSKLSVEGLCNHF